MRQLLSFDPPPADYPNYLALGAPHRQRLPSSRWLLLMLLVLCLLPRIVAAIRLPCLCIDGAVYVNMARDLEAGNFRVALIEGELNVYPVILMLLHRLGLAWETAGAVWGVIISSLVILPLWGWVRRQFDDRVALLACLLYTCHPKFIIESPEVMRDPTFWFLFTLGLYSLWRAITEVRYLYFMASGAAITLAALTRVEGLFLLIPLVLWTFWRTLALQSGRRQLYLGVVLCVAAFPMLLILINVAFLHDHLGWPTIRVSPLSRVQPWLESIVGIESASHEANAGVPMSLGRMLRVFFPTMTRGLAPLFALLMFGGVWGWRRTWARRDHQALFYTSIVIMGGIWVQLWFDGNISRRYPLPMVLMGSPWAALGLLALLNRIERLAEWFGWQVRRQHRAAVVVLILVMAAGLVHALKTQDASRQIAAEVGCWVRQSLPAPATLVGPSFMGRIVRYHAEKTHYVDIPRDADDASILALAGRANADAVILWPSKRLTAERCTSLIDRLKSAGLKPIDSTILSSAAGRYYVLVRAPRIDWARKPTQGR
jgi:hypothetical protein